MIRWCEYILIIALSGLCGAGCWGDQGRVILDPSSPEVLELPVMSQGPAGPGKRVRVTSEEYAGTDVYHTLYLPVGWEERGEILPIIFEYTGNYFPKTGSTGEVKDAGLGYGLSGGRYIWVGLPYIDEGGRKNAITWWGDIEATVNYAKLNVPRIVEKYRGDQNAVFLCGFSRGAIGVNFIGLYDDEISQFWSAFITHDHFDGVKAWGGHEWGSPLEKYRKEALIRLKRVGDRPYRVSQNGTKRTTEGYIRSSLSEVGNFTFAYPRTLEIFGHFPNELAKASHTDLWPLLPSVYRTDAWKWMNRVAGRRLSE